ncbi:hypothetical protein ACFLWN_02825 [Chloroflexota bacterium]
MKRILLGFVLIIVLSVVSLGCGKVTGGGSVLEADRGERIVFNLNVAQVEDWEHPSLIGFKGSFHLRDIEHEIVIYGRSKANDPNFPNFTYNPSSGYCTAWEVTVNGEEGYTLDMLQYNDDPSEFVIWVYDLSTNTPVYDCWVLEQDIKGAIKFHK